MSIKPGDKVWLAERGGWQVRDLQCRCVDNGGWAWEKCPECKGFGSVHRSCQVEPMVTGPHTVTCVTTHSTVSGESVYYTVVYDTFGNEKQTGLVFLTEEDAWKYANRE